jgi:hypothetical protein
MTNEEVMQMLTGMGLHEGGMENWVPDNAWVLFANKIEERFKQKNAGAAATLDEMRKRYDDHFAKALGRK